MSTTFDLETIYSLLPAVYRTRDAAIADTLEGLLTPTEQAQLQKLRNRLGGGKGAVPLNETEQRELARLEEKRVRGPLKALLTIIAEQVAGLEENIEQLYDDQFIETCAEWVVPYIADLIGYRPFDPRLQDQLGSSRADVANTIRFRRRKGTAAVLEELASDITGWDVTVVEFFQRLAVTQYLNHLRLETPGHGFNGGLERTFDQPGTVNLRRADRLELAGTPFDPASHTADVRRISSQHGPNSSRGYWNIPNLGIFVWRVGSHHLTDAQPFRVDARRYLFNPLGANTQLYCAADREADVMSLAGPLNVPIPITRRMLRSNLAQLYGPGKSLTVQRGNRVLTIDEVDACDLSDTGPDPNNSQWAHPNQTRVAIDPVLGRIYLPTNVPAEEVRVSYYYGALSDIGGGEYVREERLRAAPGKLRRIPIDPADQPDLVQALADLGGAGTVEITGSCRDTGLTELTVSRDSQLEIRAANGSLPLIQLGGDLVIGGGDSGEVTLNGLLIAGGRITVPALVNGQPNRLQKLRLVDCTLVPGRALLRTGQPVGVVTSLEVEAPNVSVEIDHSIVGGLRVTDESRLSMSNSIIDGLGQEEVGYAAPGNAGTDGTGPGGELTVTSCTVIGKVNTVLLTASNSIFHARRGAADTWNAPVRASRRQAGYVRYSYIPLDAQVPPRYACLPRTTVEAMEMVPRFVSLSYNSPAYCQLHASCPCRIRTGAEDQGEMGVFHDQYAPQREAGLWTRLDEYLRVGLEAGVLFAS